MIIVHHNFSKKRVLRFTMTTRKSHDDYKSQECSVFLGGMPTLQPSLDRANISIRYDDVTILGAFRSMGHILLNHRSSAGERLDVLSLNMYGRG